MNKTKLIFGLMTCIFLISTGFLGITSILPTAAQPLAPAPLQSRVGGYIEVTVVDSVTATPLSSCAVYLYDDTGAQVGSVHYTTGSGWTNLSENLDIGWYTVSVWKAGYWEQNKSNYINWDYDDDYLTFYLEAAPAGSSWITVTVRDAVTTAFISSATVKIYNDSGYLGYDYTDVSGVSNFTGLYIGWYYVSVEKVGYIPSSNKSNYINWNGDDDYLTFWLTPHPPNSGWIEVTVKDNASAPLQSAFVGIYYTNGTYHSSGYTDSNGFFNATGLAIGWWDVRVSKSGYIPHTQQDYINWNGDDDYLYYYLVPYGPYDGYIECTVKNATSNALIENAYVYAIRDETGEKVISGFTDVNGFFNVTGCAIGWYTITVQAPGYQPYTKHNYINWNGDDDYLTYYLQDINPEDQSLTIYVKQQLHQFVSVPNALIAVYQGVSLVARGTTGDWGSYTVYNLNNATPYSVNVTAVGFADNGTVVDLLTLGFPAAQTTVYMTELGAGTGYIEVTVQDGVNGSIKIENALVEVYNYTTGALIDQGYTNANGFWNVTNLKIGWHTVIVSKAGVYYNKTLNNYINWEGDDDYLTFALTRVEFTTQILSLQTITPNPDPTGDIDLFWNDVQFEASYKIYRGISPGSLELVTTLAAGVTTYKDTGVGEGTWYYQIVAINGTGHTTASNIESVAVYAAGGAIPGFEVVFVLLAVVFLAMIIRRTKRTNKPFFLGTF